jgi:hypothetical protein
VSGTPTPAAPVPDTDDEIRQPGEGALARRLPALLVAGALVLVAIVIVAVVVLAGRARTAANAPDTGPLAVPAAPAPGAGGRYCTQLLRALPDRLTSHQRRPLSDPTPGVAAWGDPAIILRCGLPDPQELTCSAALTQFTDASGGSVAWLRLSDSSAVTYVAVDRPVRIALTLPPGTGIGPVQQLSEVIAKVLPGRAVCTNGTVNPLDNG